MLNRVYFAKFREPLTEGLGIAFLGVGFWALLAATDGAEVHRRSATIVGAVALGVIPGISLPALAGAAFVVAPWVIVTTVNRTSAREPGEPRSRAWLPSNWS